MRHFIIGLDDPSKPKKSALVTGPEVDDDKVRRDFYEARESGEHPDGWAALVLYGDRGPLDVSYHRPKSKGVKPPP